MYGLIAQDEEVDSSAYAAYLRSQSDADLLDIVLHLDPEHYPARADAARRETLRRRVVPLTVHTSEERFIRGLAVAVFLLSATFVLLALLLTAPDAAGPRWPDLDHVPDGTPASEIMRQCLLGILRALVVGSAYLGLAPLAFLTLFGWLLAHARSHAIRADVKRIALFALLALIAALALSAAPFSNIPALSGLSAGDPDFRGRLFTLLWPF